MAETQPTLFDVATVASPLCIYEGECGRNGRAEFGPWLGDETCRTRDVRCLTCKRTGSESQNLTLRKGQQS